MSIPDQQHLHPPQQTYNGGPIPPHQYVPQQAVSPYATAPMPVIQGPPVIPPIAPPMAPVAADRGRSAGWWAGLIGIVSTLVVLALVGGFFIGKSTRLSDDAVQTKINQQAQADRIAQNEALAALRSDLNESAAERVRRAAARAERRGRREGRASGRQAGFEDGRASGFNEGQTAGFSAGESSGYSNGLDDGACLANFYAC